MMNVPLETKNNDYMYEDLDTLFSPEPDCVTDTLKEGSSKDSDLAKTGATTKGISSSSSSASNFGLNEDQLKKEEMILYLDLVVTELDNKKKADNLKAGIIKLKNEVDSLRKSLSENNEKMSQLSTENVTLKKNICSLYKTAKSEIEQKDTLLQEANKKIDKMLEWCARKGIPYRGHRDHFENKEGEDYKNYQKRNYETSESENQAFSRPSTSYNPPEFNTKWNKVNSKHRTSYYKSEKRKHSPSPDTGREKRNNYNHTDRRNSNNKSRNNQTSPNIDERNLK